MLETSIDELTLVLQAPLEVKEKLKNEADWKKQAELIIIDFSDKAQLNKIFGLKQIEENVPQGYTNGYSFGNHSFYFCIAYNQEHFRMGIIVKFSAQALADYLQKTNLEVYSFLKMIKSKKYDFRLTRCDLDCDFENVSFTPTQIYNDLKDGTVQTFYQKMKDKKTILVRKNCKLQGFAIGKEIPTCYLGAVSSDNQLRIYDKKLEQVQKHGSRVNYFIKFDSVVRFELVLKHELAHNFTHTVLKINTKAELNSLILSVLLQKFFFKETKNNSPAKYTQLMIKALKEKESTLLGHINVDHSLEALFQYLLNGSGTVPTLYKVYFLWGENSLDKALDYIKKYILDWHVNQGCQLWLRSHEADTKSSFKGFDDLVKEPDFKDIFK